MNITKRICQKKHKTPTASGIELQMMKAVNMLSSIPPKSKCSQEALQVSKEIGDYFVKKPNEQMETKIQIVNQNLSLQNNADWNP